MDELETILYDKLRESFEARLKELPPPPPGYYYFPELEDIQQDGDEVTINGTITLKPIIE